MKSYFERIIFHYVVIYIKIPEKVLKCIIPWKKWSDYESAV